MKNDIIQEIWDIRGLLDEAINAQDFNIYNKAREKFNKIFKSEKYLITISTSTVDYEPEDIEDMRKDREQNFALIAFDFGNNLRRVEGEDLDVEKFHFSSVLEVVWYSRWMFDNFIKNFENNINMNVNTQIYQAVETNIRESVNYFENFDDETSKKETMTLIKLHMEITSKYNELYGEKEDKNNQEV